MEKGVQAYYDLIDDLVKDSSDGDSDILRAEFKSGVAEPEKVNAVLSRLSLEERKVIAELVQSRHEAGMEKVLSYFAEFRLINPEGVELIDPYDQGFIGLEGFFRRRVEGEPWEEPWQEPSSE
jgi:hypothetical protein